MTLLSRDLAATFLSQRALHVVFSKTCRRIDFSSSKRQRGIFWIQRPPIRLAIFIRRSGLRKFFEEEP
jgi:hypothetical protein